MGPRASSRMPQGNVWLASNDGIHSFSRAELDAVAEGRASRLESRKYGTIDGLRTEDAGVQGLEPSAWRGRDGRLFFASRKGVVEIDADRLPRNGLVPPVHVEELVVDRQVQAQRPSYVFEPGRENFEIHYSAPSLEVPSRVRFKYQLVGYDPGWVDAGALRTAYYTRLPPGSYLFRVIACNNDGLWNEEGASLAFTLRPHFYQTLWFRRSRAADARRQHRLCLPAPDPPASPGRAPAPDADRGRAGRHQDAPRPAADLRLVQEGARGQRLLEPDRGVHLRAHHG